ncbi:MAG: putative Ig domain-containing protein, partial [Legionellaceae bacterium]|nr:putative Ig domain-containing protein [Legionellaceae bacterium]MBP9774205.1 putative Ig domain-containing protein [Legionellaceae bacterium]
MIRRVINTVMLALIFCQSAFAAGSLFAIQESGAALEAPATITICANIDAPASCQRYIVRHTTLSILTTTGRSYARSGIKMDTSTFKVLNAYCSTTANGYCSLPLNNHTPTEIPITTVGVRLHATPAAHTEVDVTYTQQNIATGGIEPYTYSVVDGTLPAGTTLQANGTVSGTPTTHGAFSYTIQVAGALGTTDTALTSGTIARRLVITHTASADNQVGITYLQTNVASGGTAPYTYSVASGEIPAGTNLDTTTGTVSGTPTTAAAYSYTINVVDSDGGSKTTPAITGTISGRVGLNATPSTYTEVNVLYSQANVATNGTAPFHYTLDSGLLPAGTSLDPDTGTVSGPPQVTASGPFSYRIKVTDDDGAMATATTSGTINAALSTTNPSAVIADAGQTASFSAVASDGTAPYSYQWQVKPNGNTSFLNITGANSSSYTTNTLNTSNNNDQYRLKVTDAGSATATSTAATLTVHTALASSPTPVSPVADAGQTIAFGAGVTGGSNSFTYQWQVSTNGGTSFADVTTGSGGQTATYTTATLTTTNNNDQYQVIVTDTGTSTHRVVTSAARTLTVNTALASAPTPASPVADAGQTIAFDAGVTGGSGTFTYQWQYKPSGGSFSDISGAVSASYTTAALTTANSGDQYKVIVTDTGTSVATSVTSAARTLTVNTALASAPTPASPVADAGQTIAFDAGVTGGSG